MKRESRRQRGNTRLLVAAGILTLLALVFGGKELYVLMANRRPTEMTFDEYVRTRPSAKWLRITQCRYENDAALFEEKGSKIVKFYVPLRSASWDPTQGPAQGPIEIVAAVPPPSGTSALAHLMASAGVAPSSGTPSSTEIATVQGLLRFGPGSGSSARKDMRRLFDNAGPDFVVLDVGGTPNGVLAFVLLGGGVIGVIALVVIARGGGGGDRAPRRRGGPRPDQAEGRRAGRRPARAPRRSGRRFR